MNLKFYHCDICGKVITILSDTGIPTDCCGQVMKELVLNRTDGSDEKHIPVFTKNGNTVLVQIAAANGRKCGAQRPRCGISTAAMRNNSGRNAVFQRPFLLRG